VGGNPAGNNQYTISIPYSGSSGIKSNATWTTFANNSLTLFYSTNGGGSWTNAGTIATNATGGATGSQVITISTGGDFFLRLDSYVQIDPEQDNIGGSAPSLTATMNAKIDSMAWSFNTGSFSTSTFNRYGIVSAPTASFSSPGLHLTPSAQMQQSILAAGDLWFESSGSQIGSPTTYTAGSGSLRYFDGNNILVIGISASIAGPQGIQGPTGAQGPAGPGVFGGNFSGSFSGSLTGSLLATNAMGGISGSMTGSLTGSILGLVTSASYAQTASVVLGSISTASLAFNANSASWAANINNYLTGSYNITGSITASVITSAFTGSLFGSSSYAFSSSYVRTARISKTFMFGSIPTSTSFSASIDMGTENWMLVNVSASANNRFRLYTTTASMMSDINRPSYQLVSTSVGLIAEFIFTGSFGRFFGTSPLVIGANNELSPLTTIGININNLEPSTSDVTYSLNFISM
jgi:hypothetical protein